MKQPSLASLKHFPSPPHGGTLCCSTPLNLSLVCGRLQCLIAAIYHQCPSQCSPEAKLGRERKMKRQAVMHAPGLLRQRAGHKVLMDARLLREHRPLRDTSSSATAPMSQQHRSITGATTPDSYRKFKWDRWWKEWKRCVFLCNRGKVEEQEVMFCCW